MAGEMADHEPNRNPPIRINIQPWNSAACRTAENRQARKNE
jgi:hypothetical protein